MDVSTSLVQAYLHVNGYFTASDYPLVASGHGSATQSVTDIDMIAVRFGRDVGKSAKGKQRAVQGPVTKRTDPALSCSDEHTDMIVAEIKQGRVQVNPAARDQKVLAAALVRFGCCGEAEASGLVQELLQHGRVQDANSHDIRMVVFASRGESAPRGWHWVHLDHVLLFLDNYLRTERQDLRAVDLHDPALSWLALLHKCELNLKPARPAL